MNERFFPEPYERYDPIYNIKAWESRPSDLTLRDWFASQALVQFQLFSSKDGTMIFTHEQAADQAYELADAMLKQRKK